MKTDSAFLFASPFGRYFNFSTKSDPFLVFPSMKSSQPASKTKQKTITMAVPKKMLLPIQSSHLKLIR